jgi:hypothetical protein
MELGTSPSVSHGTDSPACKAAVQRSNETIKANIMQLPGYCMRDNTGKRFSLLLLQHRV